MSEEIVFRFPRKGLIGKAQFNFLCQTLYPRYRVFWLFDEVYASVDRGVFAVFQSETSNIITHFDFKNEQWNERLSYLGNEYWLTIIAYNNHTNDYSFKVTRDEDDADSFYFALHEIIKKRYIENDISIYHLSQLDIDRITYTPKTNEEVTLPINQVHRLYAATYEGCIYEIDTTLSTVNNSIFKNKQIDRGLLNEIVLEEIYDDELIMGYILETYEITTYFDLTLEKEWTLTNVAFFH